MAVFDLDLESSTDMALLQKYGPCLKKGAETVDQIFLDICTVHSCLHAF